MSDDKYSIMFACMATHISQDNMTADEKAAHLRDIARREDAEGVVDEFVSHWLSTEDDSAQGGQAPE